MICRLYNSRCHYCFFTCVNVCKLPSNDKVCITFRTIDQVTHLYSAMVRQLGQHNWPQKSKRTAMALVEMYHGHLDSGSEDLLPREFAKQTSTVRCMVATIAFGMGIQIADITYVLHWGHSASLLSYWQEVGRCGRDGKPAKAILYITPHSTDKRRNIGLRDCLLR